jgi:hypothetical protein
MRNLFSIAICILLAYGCRCSKLEPKQVMGGVENGNGFFVTGYLYTQEGIPAKNTAVRMVLFDNDPRANDSAYSPLSVTDDSGRYSFDTVASGVYNVIGENENGELSYSDSLLVNSVPTVFPPDTIKPAGRFRGVVSVRPYKPCMVFIVMLGTDLYTMTIDTIGNFTSPRLGEGRYRVIILSTSAGFDGKEILVDVVAGKTTTIDTVYLAYSGIDTLLNQTFHETETRLSGAYSGIVTTPWQPPCAVAMTIDSIGHYSAYNTETRDAPALYYGFDTDDPSKKISLVQINANGGISGHIVLIHYGGSTTTEEIREMRFNSGFDSLNFEMWHSGIYGPVQVSLRRIPVGSLPPRPLPTPAITVIGKLSEVKFAGALSESFEDSVSVSITVEGGYTIIYQVIDPPLDFPYNSCLGEFPTIGIWSNDAPIQTYGGPFIISGKSIDKLVLARAKDGNAPGGVKGYRIIIK